MSVPIEERDKNNNVIPTNADDEQISSNLSNDDVDGKFAVLKY